MTLLSLLNVAKAYGGTPALRGVDLTIAPGEIHALMGENGAGKSTLIKILAGVVAPDSATITMDDRPITIDSPAAAYRHGLRFIHQEFNVVPALSVAENLFIGRRYPTRGPFVDWRQLHAEARAALETLGITHIDPRTRIARLSLGDQMLVRISSAFLGTDGGDARLYVMDEPTAALTAEESERLFKLLRQIRQSGNAVLYVSHRLDEVMALCDRATVLRDGKHIDSGQLSGITHDDLVALMIGRKVGEAYPPRTHAPDGSTAFRAKTLRARGFGPLNLEIGAGEILGIAGLSGAGQREVLRAIFGDLKTGGTMTLDGAAYAPRSPADAWRHRVAYVPRERRSEGLVTSRPIFENVTLPHLGAHSRHGFWLAPRRERQFSEARGSDVRLKADGPKQIAARLSGGNQQKVVFAKALAGDPVLLLLDEPTRGVDIGAKFDIYSIIRDMTAKGMAVLLVSSDLPELIGMCDRIAVLRDGKIVATVPATGLAEEDLLNLCYGRAAGPEAA